MLLGAGILVQTVLGFVVDAEPEPTLDRLDLRLGDVLLTAGLNLITTLPATLLLGIAAPLGRWRRYAGLLLLARGLELLGIGLILMAGPPWSAAESLAVRLLIHGQLALGIFEFWAMAVLISEFADRHGAPDLVEQTGQLGWLILLALGVTLALSAWSLPRHFPPYLSDDFSKTLLGLAILSRLAVQIWLFGLISLAATLARRASERRRA